MSSRFLASDSHDAITNLSLDVDDGKVFKRLINACRTCPDPDIIDLDEVDHVLVSLTYWVRHSPRRSSKPASCASFGLTSSKKCCFLVSVYCKRFWLPFDAHKEENRGKG